MQKVKNRKSNNDAEAPWLDQAAFLALHCGYTVEQSKAVEPKLYDRIYRMWMEEVKLQERFTARIVATVANFASSFSKNPKKFSENDFMGIGRKKQYLTPEIFKNMINAAGAQNQDKQKNG